MDYKISDYFPTSILEAEGLLPTYLNDEIKEYIYMLRDISGKDKAKSWHSDFSLLINPVESMAKLKLEVEKAFAAFADHWMAEEQDDLGHSEVKDPNKGQTRQEMWSWAVIQKAHDYVPPHVHPDATFSCVYYCSVPELSYPEGHIEFLNPTVGAAVTMPYRHRERLIIRPRDKLLIIFPAYFQHWVHPFKNAGEADRIAIGFDIRIKTDYKVSEQYLENGYT